MSLPPLERLALRAGARTGVTQNSDGTVTLSKEEADDYLKAVRKRAVYNAMLVIAIHHFVDFINYVWGHDMGDVSGYGPEVETWSEKKERRMFHEQFPIVKKLEKWQGKVEAERDRALAQMQGDPIDEKFLRRANTAVQKYWSKEIHWWTDEDEKRVYAKLKAQAKTMATHDPYDKADE